MLLDITRTSSESPSLKPLCRENKFVYLKSLLAHYYGLIIIQQLLFDTNNNLIYKHIGVQPGILQGKEGLLERGLFDEHFTFHTRMKGAAEKISEILFLRYF